MFIPPERNARFFLKNAHLPYRMQAFSRTVHTSLTESMVFMILEVSGEGVPHEQISTLLPKIEHHEQPSSNMYSLYMKIGNMR